MPESESASALVESANETNVTDIELMPDGRIFVFGTSRQVLEVLLELQTAGEGEIVARLSSCGPEAVPTASNRGSSS